MAEIKADLPGGFKDYLPEESKKRKYLLEKIEEAFRRFGFSFMENSSIELLDVLTGGDSNSEKQIFEVSQFDSEKESRMGLRFDLTVPLVRSLSMNINDFNMPSKVYRIGNVWRGEKPQAGRYREFKQCDIDILGVKGLEADAEIISLIYSVFLNLGLNDFKIKINDRRVLNNFLSYLGVKEENFKDILILIDKLDKSLWSEIKEGLLKKGLKEDQVNEMKIFIESDLNKIKDSYKDNKELLDSVDNLEELSNLLLKLGVPEDNFEVDFSIVRGLDYYTGIIFEAILNDSEIGSVFSGGRYDDLINKFTGSSIPAVGASLGFDRFFEAVKNKEIFNDAINLPEVLILNFEESCKNEYFEALKELRKANISTSIYLGNEENLKGQLSYAAKEEIPVVLIMGEKEKKEGIFQIKDMRKRMQDFVSMEFLVDKVKETLAS